MKSDKQNNKPQVRLEPEQPNDGSSGRASFHPGTTTQGGSNHGQGSHYLAGASYKQGSERNSGADYENEVGRLSELEPGDED